MEGPTQRFLEGLAEIIDTLNREANPSPFNPSIAVLSALILTATASFSSEPGLPLLILMGSIVLILLARSPIYSWVKIVIFIALWATVVSIPLLFITPGKPIVSLPLNPIELKVSCEGLDMMVAFVARVTAAAAIFTSFAFMLGWRKIVKGLEGLRVPREITFLLTLSIIHIPLLFREASKMLSAREARIIKKIRFRYMWSVLATVIGDLLLKSHEHAWRLERAINARSFASLGFPRRNFTAKVKIKDLALLLSALCVPTAGFLVGL